MKLDNLVMTTNSDRARLKAELEKSDAAAASSKGELASCKAVSKALEFENSELRSKMQSLEASLAESNRSLSRDQPGISPDETQAEELKRCVGL